MQQPFWTGSDVGDGLFSMPACLPNLWYRALLRKFSFFSQIANASCGEAAALDESSRVRQRTTSMAMMVIAVVVVSLVATAAAVRPSSED